MNTRHALTLLDCLRMQKDLYDWNPEVNAYAKTTGDGSFEKAVAEDLSEAVCFKIDNVADMMTAGREGELIEVDFNKLPCVRPPYPTTWLEFTGNYKMICKNCKHEDHEHKRQVIRTGVLFLTVVTTAEEAVKRYAAGGGPDVDKFSVFVDETLKDHKGMVTTLEAEVFFQRQGQMVIGPVARTYISLLPSGAVEDATEPDMDWCGPKDKPWVANALAVPLQALALMHCRNVSVAEKEPPTTIAERHKRSHPPMVKYKMLSIKPMGKRFSQSAAPGTPGSSETPYHICRGHFKTFDEKPLLGRTRGTFWWGHFARGNKKHGEVIKDYDVRPGEEVSRPGDDHHDRQPSQGEAQAGPVPS